MVFGAIGVVRWGVNFNGNRAVKVEGSCSLLVELNICEN